MAKKKIAALLIAAAVAAGGWALPARVSAAENDGTALQRKRIDRELIDAALAQADRQDMAGRLRQQLERKMRTTRHTTQYELKTKLIRYGLSLGYDYETVLDSAAALVTDTETCDEF